MALVAQADQVDQVAAQDLRPTAPEAELPIKDLMAATLSLELQAQAAVAAQVQ